MFDLEKAIGAWRVRLQDEARLTFDDAEELESHLRDEIERLCLLPLKPQESFFLATMRLGDADSLAAEYRKNRRSSAALIHKELGRVDWPEECVYAGPSRRLMALMFDLCIHVLAGLLVLTLFELPLAWSVLTVAALKVFLVAYVVGTTYYFGGTPGKILAGIRVCRANGDAISFGQALLRNLPYLFAVALALVFYTQARDGMLTVGSPEIYAWLWFSVAATSMLWLLASIGVLVCDKHARTLHDFLAGTVVVDEHFARTHRQETSGYSAPAGAMASARN